MKAVGRNVLRKDGIDKVRGTSKYVDDMLLPGMLYGRTIRSTVASATIASVDLAFDTSGFTVVNFSDIPGRNVVALIDADQPALAERVVRHVAEPILLLAHENRETLWSVEPRIEYQPQTPLFDPALSTTSFKSIDIQKGDLHTGFALADHIVEGEYPDGTPGAALYRAQWCAGGPVERRGHGVRVAPVPVLRAPGAHRAARPPGR